MNTLLLLLSTLSVSAEVRDLVVDPMDSAAHWQLGGNRLNYVLGESSVGPSAQQVRQGAKAALKLTYDFREERRQYLSAYWTGLPIPGQCAAVSFWLYGDHSERPVELSLEDAAERWYKRRLGAVDWDGWRQLTVPVGDGEGWSALLRRGEKPQPLQHPVTLRQIALLLKADAPPQGAAYLHELTAKTDVQPLDFVDARVTTGREGNLFYASEPAVVRVRLTNRGDAKVSEPLGLMVEDYFGGREPVSQRQVTLAPGESSDVAFEYRPDRVGSYLAKLSLGAGDRERTWLCRFAVSKPGRELPADHNALFGCHAFLSSFQPEQMEAVFRLNRDAGIRWERLGFSWQHLEPKAGRFAWDPPETVEGVVGRALACDGGGAVTVPASDSLSLTDALTLAFWFRSTGKDGNWQWLLTRSSGAAERTYGVYVHKDTGVVCYSGGFEAFPGRPFMDFTSGASAWDGEWRHFAATYSAASGKLLLYVDGKLAMEHAVNGGRVRASKQGLQFGGPFQGMLDEVALYDRALSADEVAGLAAKQAPPSAGLVGWWTFDKADDPGRDSGPHGLHARAGRTPHDDLIDQAKAHGIRILGLLGFPPKWASTAPDDAARPWVYKPKLDAWARFVEGVTRRYRGVVDHWELWNEPNISVFWEPTPDAKEFFDVARVGYEAAKRGNPACTVITPGLAGPGRNLWGMSFLDDLIGLGVPKHCDALSIHPYRQDSPEESDLVGDLTHLGDLSAEHGARRNLWITEWCWTTQLGAQLGGGSDERRSAQMLGRGIVLALATGLIDRLIVFRLHDPGVDRFYTEHNYGLCWNDLTPKPAYFALRTCAELLDGAVVAAPSVAAPAKGAESWALAAKATSAIEDHSVWTRRFVRNNEHLLAVWTTNGESMTAFNVAAPTARVVDLMGNERTEKTRDGVLLLRASEDLQFVRGLGKGARQLGALLSVKPPARSHPGEQAPLEMTLRNPFGAAKSAKLKVTSPDNFVDYSATVTVPPNGTLAVRAAADLPAGATPGRKPITVSIDWAGTTWTQPTELLVSTVDPEAGPVGRWTFDEGTGTVTHDASGNNNDGAVTGCRWVPGKHGTALAFGGGAAPEVGAGPGGDRTVTDLVVIPDAPSLDLPEEVTLAFYLKLTGDTGTWQFPVNKYLGHQVRNYGVYIRPDAFAPCFSASFEGADYRHSDVSTSINLNDGNWHHLCATVSVLDQRVTVYVDGRLATQSRSVPGAMLTNDEPLRIGAGTNGIIDEVVVWPRALTAEEVQAVSKGAAAWR